MEYHQDRVVLDENSKQTLGLQPHITDLPPWTFVDVVWLKAKRAQERFMEADHAVYLAYSVNSYSQIENAKIRRADAAILLGTLSEMCISASLHQAGIMVAEKENDTRDITGKRQDPA